MPAVYTPITQREMEDFLEINPETGRPNDNSHRNFYRLEVPGTKELVYGKVVAPGITLRILSSIVPGYGSRDVGEDAIRTLLVWTPDPKKVEPKIIGQERIVKRTQGWRESLNDRIESWEEQLGPECEKCGCPTVRRQKRGSKRGEGYFFGCAQWPNCPGTRPPQAGKTETAVVATAAAPKHDPQFDYVPVAYSQLHYLIVTAMCDNQVTVEAICEAASILYGNKDAFRIKNGLIEMHAGIKKWLPNTEQGGAA